MSATTRGPRAGAGDATGAWLILGVVGIVAAGAGVMWLAGGLASVLAGEGWGSVPFNIEFLTRLLADGPRAWWPSTPPGFVFAVAAVLASLLVGAGVWGAVRWRRRRPPVGDPFLSLASPADMPTLTASGARTRAVELRPSLVGVKRLDDREVGVRLGELEPGGQPLFASWEDVGLAIMAPRSMKTTALSIPIALAAPGALIATENKAGLWAATADLRAARSGRRVWVFDPNHITHQPQGCWWNPLTGVDSFAAAFRFAGHFTATTVGRDGDRDFWIGAAQDLLAGLFLAASVGERPITVVYGWLNDSGNPEPDRILRTAGFVADADSLAGRRAGAVETREGIFENARTAAQCLRNPQILAWVTPSDGVDELHPHRLVTGGETLYLMAKDDQGAASPLVAALVDAVFTTATRLAERSPAGRLDPPVTVVLDEAANIVRIADLPQLYSHLGSRGIATWTILQSKAQGERVWGKPGFAALWGAATVKVIGPGIDDATFADDISRLVGDHDVQVRSTTFGRMGDRSDQLSLRRERVLPPDKIRSLPKGTALVFATGTPAALIKLQPWFTGPDRAAIGTGLTSKKVANDA